MKHLALAGPGFRVERPGGYHTLLGGHLAAGGGTPGLWRRKTTDGLPTVCFTEHATCAKEQTHVNDDNSNVAHANIYIRKTSRYSALLMQSWSELDTL